jgi:lipopolysaccharide export system permease protein
MIKTFELYLILLFAKKILNTFLIFFTLIFILNLFEEINFFKDLQTNFFFPIILSGLNAPATLFEIFPFIFLIGTQFFFLDIIDKNELEILKINGLSNIRILKTLFITSLLFGFILITIFYAISAKLQFIYFDIKNSYSNDDKYLAVVKESGLWIKDEIDNKIYIINADEISNNSLINVSIHAFNNNLQLIHIINSEEIDISSYEWILSKPIIFKDNKTTQLKEKYFIKTHFDIKKINSLFDNLSSLNVFQLLKLRNDYSSLGNSTREVDIHLHKLYSLPLFISIMTILSSIIMFNNKRNTSIIFHLLSGILFSVIVYYLSYLSYLMGENGKIPIIVSTYLPFMILILISLIGIVRLNEK